MKNAIEPWRPPPRMTTGKIAGLTLGVLVVGLVVSQIPDFIRWLRMSSM